MNLDINMDINTNVYVIRCDSYETADEKINELLDMMGGITQFVKPGDRITLKANLLGAAAPEQAVSTHPAIVAAVGKAAKGVGAVPTIADSPGSGYRYNEATLKKLYAACGMDRAAEEAGIALNWNTGYDEVSYPEGRLIKHMEVIKPITEADGVINLCKMKTHLFMHMTGAVKNHFGIIPGLSKVGFHAKLQDKALFADMLLDLAGYVSPRLSIMDAVLAMEGDGPGVSGTPRQVGLLLASTSPLALDIAAAAIMGLPREQHPVLLAAERRGMTPNRLEDITIIGGDLADFRLDDYVFPATIDGLGLSSGGGVIKTTVYRELLSQYPVVRKDRCVGCGVCRDSCPQQAITVRPGKNRKPLAVIAQKQCIRCYCCHELCPHQAVEVKKNPLAKLLNL